MLVAGLVDNLAEVAVAIQQTHRDQRQSQVAGSLEMVARKYTEAARIDGQRLGDGELSTEVGDPRYTRNARTGVQVLLQIAVLFKNALGMLSQAVGVVGDGLQDGNRIVRPAPRVGRQGLKEFERTRIPGPAQVVRQVLEKRNEVGRSVTHAQWPVGHDTRFIDFSSIWHVWFRVPRGHPHE